MPAKLGLPALIIAFVIALAAPVLADTTVPDTSVGEGSSVSTTSDPDVSTTTTPAPTTPAPTTTSTAVPVEAPATASPLESGALAVAGGANVARAQTPRRGTQLQITKPPPPPPPSAFDPPVDGGFGRRVVYSKTQQTVWVYDERNTIIKMHRVSGRQTPLDPAPGRYRVWSRSIRTYSINNPSITWGYMVRFAKGARGGNIGFHEIPFQYGRPVQSEAQLGQALSGGCVRQARADAIWMWNWAQLGTVVIVTP